QLQILNRDRGTERLSDFLFPLGKTTIFNQCWKWWLFLSALNFPDTPLYIRIYSLNVGGRHSSLSLLPAPPLFDTDVRFKYIWIAFRPKHEIIRRGILNTARRLNHQHLHN